MLYSGNTAENKKPRVRLRIIPSFDSPSATYTMRCSLRDLSIRKYTRRLMYEKSYYVGR